MGINVWKVNSQVNTLHRQETKLRDAERKLQLYKQMFESDWQGEETIYFVNAIESAERRLEQAAKDLKQLAKDITTAAKEIIEAEEE